jgi:microtubule-associated protein-like 6
LGQAGKGGERQLSRVPTAAENPAAEAAQQQQTQVDEDTDDHEDGYDSDVNREMNIDYQALAYNNRPSVNIGEWWRIWVGSCRCQSPPQTTSWRSTRKSTTPRRCCTASLRPSKRRRLVRPRHPPKSTTPTSILFPSTAPAKLQLQHIHGYRGYDSRNNVQAVDGDRIVYHVAAVGIVHHLRQNRQSVTESITCHTLLFV